MGGGGSNAKQVDPHTLCFICFLLPFCVSLLAQLNVVAEDFNVRKAKELYDCCIENGTKRSPHLF